MTRRILTLLTALATAVITAVVLATPAQAFAITAGFMITSGGRWCTVSFPDPKMPNIVYTAGHCFQDGITDVSLGNIRIGEFLPQIHDSDLDIIAIRLNDRVASDYSLMSREPLLSPWVPHKGATVCKYGATTQETCGKVLSVDGERFAVDMPAQHGDSGAPIYEQNLDDETKGVHMVGTLISSNRENPNIIYCTQITALEAFLGRTWGGDWNMA